MREGSLVGPEKSAQNFGVSLLCADCPSAMEIKACSPSSQPLELKEKLNKLMPWLIMNLKQI